MIFVPAQSFDQGGFQQVYFLVKILAQTKQDNDSFLKSIYQNWIHHHVLGAHWMKSTGETDSSGFSSRRSTPGYEQLGQHVHRALFIESPIQRNDTDQTLTSDSYDICYELERLKIQKDTLEFENRKLQNDNAALRKDFEELQNLVELENKKLENLRLQSERIQKEIDQHVNRKPNASDLLEKLGERFSG